MVTFVRHVVIHPGGELNLITIENKRNSPNSDRCFSCCLSIFGFQVCFYRHDYRDYSQEEDFDLVSFFMVTD